ncbi:hypothetical protein [Pseudomonas sp. Irchel 3A7]|uniref:hypothetical protein n=1 Tax=Pseudomonas sp. Irchel 3A7 TaxID=2008913 RepID=UPI0011402CAF|nr:hypothetical protein [Pseudomonas sp. Irchel 3A7]
MKKLIVASTLLLSALSSMAFAENGGDRVFERNVIRVQEAIAAQEKAKYTNQNTAKSDVEEKSKSS